MIHDLPRDDEVRFRKEPHISLVPCTAPEAFRSLTPSVQNRLVLPLIIGAVTVLDDGFEYNGKAYRSLSAIAFEVTGTRWNGFHFFGLRRVAA